MLVIKSENFLTSSNLVYDNGAFKWCTDIPDDAIISDEGVRSLEEIAAVFGKNIEPLVPSNYLNSANKLSVNPPWSLYIGNQRVESYIRNTLIPSIKKNTPGDYRPNVLDWKVIEKSS